MISAVLEIALSCLGSFVYCFMLCREVSRAVRGRIDPFSWETVPPLCILLFRNLSDRSLRLMIFVRNSDGSAVAQDTRSTRHSRSPSGKISANSALLPDQSQTIGHDGSSCGSTACALGRGSDPMATRVRSTLFFCRCAFSKSSCHKSSRSYWIFLS